MEIRPDFSVSIVHNGLLVEIDKNLQLSPRDLKEVFNPKDRFILFKTSDDFEEWVKLYIQKAYVDLDEL